MRERRRWGQAWILTQRSASPLVRLIASHNAFSRNIKVSFGALEMLSRVSAVDGSAGPIALPTGTEPWGRETRWRNLRGPVKEAAGFLAEIGLARATASFEDYLTGAKAEFDSAGLEPVWPKRNGTTALQGFDAIVGIERSSIVDLARMATFFDVARNCVVHRSNRASSELSALSADPSFMETLGRWPKRVGKWKLSLPPIKEGDVVDWRPRHASDVYYRCATTLDRMLVRMMGASALVQMAAHWCFFADFPAPCSAKLSPETMVRRRSLLGARHHLGGDGRPVAGVGAVGGGPRRLRAALSRWSRDLARRTASRAAPGTGPLGIASFAPVRLWMAVRGSLTSGQYIRGAAGR
jgi:hypothetical protein